ncbi:hypothetical protein ACMV5I_23715 [Serratia sp. T13T92]|uniref:hypothetical protein n=1 Tax=Serratia sp. T13T92 TaxID=3397496 RepID=UPI0039E0A553
MTGKVKSFLKMTWLNAAPWLLIVFISMQVLSSLDKSVDQAKYSYSRKVISYGLSDANTDAEVVERIQTWQNDKWGAQISAIQTGCDGDMEFINSLLSNRNGAMICRIAK